MKTSRRGAVVAGTIAIFLPFVTVTVHAAPATKPLAVAGISTQIDWVIDAYLAPTANPAATDVASLSKAPALSAADLRVAREQLQMQFQSLSAADQQRIVAASQTASSDAAVASTIQALRTSVQNAAVSALKSAQGAAATAKVDPQGIQPKLGGTGLDQVFVPTANPCRIYDSRNGPGPLAGGVARQIYTISIGPGYAWASDQGGTGTSGTGNCVGTVFPTVRPIAAVVIVSVINTTSSGALQAWNGGTTLSGGAVLNWNAGDRLTNTTVIPMDRTLAPFPGSGGKRDIAVFNNSGNPMDFVMDVVGYFNENTATPLDCVNATVVDANVATGTRVFEAPVCPAGYTVTGGGVDTGSNDNMIMNASSPSTNTTWFTSLTNTGAMRTFTFYSRCCRVPGL